MMISDRIRVASASKRFFSPAALSCNENDGESMDRDSQYSSSQKTKRMRTSFKHHQLRTMKSYFAINHNPDAKDLKQLAQKTGLTKRVLQVTTAAFLFRWCQGFLCSEKEETDCNRGEEISLASNVNQPASKYKIYDVRFPLKDATSAALL